MKHEIGFKGRMLARSEDDGDGRTIEGVAVPFGDVIDVWGERETFDPDTVFEGLDSAKLYYQHDTLIGSITSGENREDGRTSPRASRTPSRGATPWPCWTRGPWIRSVWASFPSRTGRTRTA